MQYNIVPCYREQNSMIKDFAASPGIYSSAVWQVPEPQLWCSGWQDLQTAAAVHTRERTISFTSQCTNTRFSVPHQCFPRTKNVIQKATTTHSDTKCTISQCSLHTTQVKEYSHLGTIASEVSFFDFHAKYQSYLTNTSGWIAQIHKHDYP